MHKTLILALAAGSLAIGATATAQDRPERPDRNASMTRADVETRNAAMFARMDANSDGVIDTADREARARTRFDAADANGDGALTFEEMQARREAHRANREERRAERGAEAGQHEGRRGGHRMGRRGGGRMGGGMLRGADADNNGSITQAEFAAAALARFDAADANNDGTVTAEERRAQRQEHMGNRRERRSNRDTTAG